VQALVDDQFTTGQKRFDVKRPVLFCTPANKNGEGIINPAAHMVCYQVKAARGEPRHARTNVFANDQFGPQTITTMRETLLCVPSTKTLGP
jgi:hypothetical protein